MIEKVAARKLAESYVNGNLNTPDAVDAYGAILLAAE
jgi:hypothetical protein